MGRELPAQWKTPVLIEGRPDGAGVIAINAARAAAPDGHTPPINETDAISTMPAASDEQLIVRNYIKLD